MILKSICKFFYGLLKLIWGLLKIMIDNITGIIFALLVIQGFLTLDKGEKLDDKFLFVFIIMSVYFVIDYVDKKIKK